MATKAEYLATLEVDSFRVTEPAARELNPESLAAGVTAYNVTVYVEKLQPDGTVMMTSATQIFYVFDEGTPQEDTRAALKEWKSEAPNPFVDQVRAFADSYLTDDRHKIVVDAIDAGNEFALLTAYESEAGGAVSTKRYFVARDDQGTPYSREFTG